MRTRTTIATLTAAALIALGCGSGGSDVENTTTDSGGTPAAAKGTAGPAKPKAADIGDTLTVTASGIKANWSVTDVQVKATDQYGSKPDNGGKYVLAEVKVDVKQGTDAYICGCDLTLVSKTGRVYEMTFASFKSRPDFQSANLAAGQNTDGWVIFGVAAKDLPGSRIQLKQQSLFDDTVFGYWNTKL